jgi:shikimate dehydrogenase
MNCDAHTELYGIIGHPVGHSLSPAIHNAAFRQIKKNAVYLAFDVLDLPGAIEGIRALGIKGLSVTIPHKEAIFGLLDEIDPVASRIGAVNTVINREGHLVGTNTDWMGAVRALKEATELKGKRVLVIGAGGASRAVCIGLMDMGVAGVHIANRTPERARALAGVCNASWSGLDGISEVEASILINTTSVGMTPDVDEIPIPPEFLSRFQVVMDIVYSPIETRLLREASERGCKTVKGIKMLLYQGIAQFELWTGETAPISVMESALKASIGVQDG